MRTWRETVVRNVLLTAAVASTTRSSRSINAASVSWPSPSAPSSTGGAAPLGPIIGGTLGGVALIALLALGFAALLLCHKRKLRQLNITAAAAAAVSA